MSINMEYIKAQVQRRAAGRQLSALATHAGCTVRTLQRLADGKSCSVTMAERVQTALKETEHMTKIKRAEVA